MSSILLPMPEHLKLESYLIVITLLIHLPYMGMLLGSTFFSLLFRGVDRIEPNAKLKMLGLDILNILPCNLGVGIILGIIPLAALMLLYSQWFYETSFEINSYFRVIIGLVTGGYVLQWIYHRRINRGDHSLFIDSLGSLGFVILISAYFIFISTLSLAFSPEHWTLLTTPVPLVFNANSFARFCLFITLSFAFTGLGILIFYSRKNENQHGESYTKLVYYFGAGLMLASAIILPLMLLWHVITIPTSALSVVVFIFYLISLIFITRVGLKTYRFLLTYEHSVNKKSFVAAILFLAFVLIGDEFAKNTANFDHTSVLIDRALAMRFELEDKRGGVALVKPNVALGKEVYKTRCMTCHEFDKRKVGPPHKEAIEKYKNDRETLKKYIKAPWKVNPEYPAMTAQALNRKELESVVLYMMEELGKVEK